MARLVDTTEHTAGASYETPLVNVPVLSVQSTFTLPATVIREKSRQMMSLALSTSIAIVCPTTRVAGSSGGSSNKSCSSSSSKVFQSSDYADASEARTIPEFFAPSANPGFQQLPRVRRSKKCRRLIDEDEDDRATAANDPSQASKLFEQNHSQSQCVIVFCNREWAR